MRGTTGNPSVLGLKKKKKKRCKNMGLVISSVRVIFNNSKDFLCLRIKINFCLQIY